MLTHITVCYPLLQAQLFSILAELEGPVSSSLVGLLTASNTAVTRMAPKKRKQLPKKRRLTPAEYAERVAEWTSYVRGFGAGDYFASHHFQSGLGTVQVGQEANRRTVALWCGHYTFAGEWHHLCCRCRTAMGGDPCLLPETRAQCGYCSARTLEELAERADMVRQMLQGDQPLSSDVTKRASRALMSRAIEQDEDCLIIGRLPDLPRRRIRRRAATQSAASASAAAPSDAAETTETDDADTATEGVAGESGRVTPHALDTGPAVTSAPGAVRVTSPAPEASILPRRVRLAELASAPSSSIDDQLDSDESAPKEAPHRPRASLSEDHILATRTRRRVAPDTVAAVESSTVDIASLPTPGSIPDTNLPVDVAAESIEEDGEVNVFDPTDPNLPLSLNIADDIDTVDFDSEYDLGGESSVESDQENSESRDERGPRDAIVNTATVESAEGASPSPAPQPNQYSMEQYDSLTSDVEQRVLTEGDSSAAVQPLDGWEVLVRPRRSKIRTPVAALAPSSVVSSPTWRPEVDRRSRRVVPVARGRTSQSSRFSNRHRRSIITRRYATSREVMTPATATVSDIRLSPTREGGAPVLRTAPSTPRSTHRLRGFRIPRYAQALALSRHNTVTPARENTRCITTRNKRGATVQYRMAVIRDFIHQHGLTVAESRYRRRLAAVVQLEVMARVTQHNYDSRSYLFQLVRLVVTLRLYSMGVNVEQEDWKELYKEMMDEETAFLPVSGCSRREASYQLKRYKAHVYRYRDQTLPGRYVNPLTVPARLPPVTQRPQTRQVTSPASTMSTAPAIEHSPARASVSVSGTTPTSPVDRTDTSENVAVERDVDDSESPAAKRPRLGVDADSSMLSALEDIERGEEDRGRRSEKKAEKLLQRRARRLRRRAARVTAASPPPTMVRPTTPTESSTSQAETSPRGTGDRATPPLTTVTSPAYQPTVAVERLDSEDVPLGVLMRQSGRTSLEFPESAPSSTDSSVFAATPSPTKPTLAVRPSPRRSTTNETTTEPILTMTTPPPVRREATLPVISDVPADVSPVEQRQHRLQQRLLEQGDLTPSAFRSVMPPGESSDPRVGEVIATQQTGRVGEESDVTMTSGSDKLAGSGSEDRVGGSAVDVPVADVTDRDDTSGETDGNAAVTTVVTETGNEHDDGATMEVVEEASSMRDRVSVTREVKEEATSDVQSAVERDDTASEGGYRGDLDMAVDEGTEEDVDEVYSDGGDEGEEDSADNIDETVPEVAPAALFSNADGRALYGASDSRGATPVSLVRASRSTGLRTACDVATQYIKEESATPERYQSPERDEPVYDPISTTDRIVNRAFQACRRLPAAAEVRRTPVAQGERTTFAHSDQWAQRSVLAVEQVDADVLNFVDRRQLEIREQLDRDINNDNLRPTIAPPPLEERVQAHEFDRRTAAPVYFGTMPYRVHEGVPVRSHLTPDSAMEIRGGEIARIEGNGSVTLHALSRITQLLREGSHLVSSPELWRGLNTLTESAIRATSDSYATAVAVRRFGSLPEGMAADHRFQRVGAPITRTPALHRL